MGALIGRGTIVRVESLIQHAMIVHGNEERARIYETWHDKRSRGFVKENKEDKTKINGPANNENARGGEGWDGR